MFTFYTLSTSAWLVHALFQTFYNIAANRDEDFLFLHKAGLQSKIASARKGVCLPPCSALTNKTHPDMVCTGVRGAAFHTAL